MATKLSTDVIDLSGNTEALTIPSGITASSINIDFLVVAGGGGGGRSTSTGSAGGGGAGGLLTSFGTSGGNQSALAALSLAVNTNHIVEIGTGGSGLSSGNGQGGDGTNSTLGTIISTGGGGGGYANQDGRPGGSGGGGGNGCSSGGAATGTTAHPIQGMQGGGAIHNSPNYPIGGGGGASTTENCGSNGNDMPGGGAGLTVNTGVTNNAYAGGGASGWYNTSNRGGGSFNGIGGGGGYPYGGGTYVPVVANSGSGGGGSGTGTSGPGADGIVIIKYETANTITISAGLTYSSTTSGSDTIVTFTAGTGTISFAGTSVGRPSSPTEGLMRENTTTGKMEFYDGSLWQEINDTASSYSSVLIPSANFTPVIYTGNGGTQNITTGFNPDFGMFKARNANGPWSLQDSVTGNFYLRSNSTDAAAATNGYNVTSWTTSDTEITVKDDANGAYNINGSPGGSYAGNGTYVGYVWKAGGAAVQNNDGTITGSNCMVSANVDAGFSIIKFTGTGSSFSNQTVGTGLDSAVEIYFIKGLSNSSDSWIAGGSVLAVGGNNLTSFLRLNTTDAIGNTTSGSVGTSGNTINVGVRNYSSADSIVYGWHSVPGYSKIGFYVGTETTQNIYMGFKPAWIILKSTTSGAANSYWTVFDNKRNPSNPRTCEIYPNSTDTEYCTVGSSPNYRGLNFTDTGIELLSTSYNNELGKTFIYMAFSE